MRTVVLQVRVKSGEYPLVVHGLALLVSLATFGLAAIPYAWMALRRPVRVVTVEAPPETPAEVVEVARNHGLQLEPGERRGMIRRNVMAVALVAAFPVWYWWPTVAGWIG